MAAMSKRPILCWIRRDLRLADHPALFHALKTDHPVELVFVFDENILSPLKIEKRDARLSFIIGALRELESELNQYKSSLKILHGDPKELIPKYAEERKAVAVYWCRDYEPYAVLRDQAVREKLEKLEIESLNFQDHVIMEKSDVLKDDGEVYKVFTPYKKKWIEKFLANGKAISNFRPNLKNLNETSHEESIQKIDWHKKLGFKEITPALAPSREAALKRLHYFETSILPTYHESRDYTDRDGTSLLSVYLRHGLISVREMLKITTNLSDQGEQTWLSELIWREFYQMLLATYPNLIKQSFKPSYDRIEWLGSEANFKSWCEGKTGFPLVDAAMRCLNETGLMPNRLRMVCASFLCKTLLVNWRLGEEYFARKLLDFDLAANNGGWQWCASTGADAQPYFRIFNPYNQSEKFDPSGEFIKRWCPELAMVEDRFIHRPDQMNSLEEELSGCRLGQEYPYPIVDYALNRACALEMYEVSKGF